MGLYVKLNKGVKMADTRSGKVNLNSASVDELSRIPGIGKEHAKDIVNYRPFRSWDDLKKVPGFSDTMVQDIRDNCSI